MLRGLNQFGQLGVKAPKSCDIAHRKNEGSNEIQLGLTLFLLSFPGGTKNDVVDGPCVQIHQLWPSVPDPRGLLHQTSKRPTVVKKNISLTSPGLYLYSGGSTGIPLHDSHFKKLLVYLKSNL